jgi:hypothetical protein
MRNRTPSALDVFRFAQNNVALVNSLTLDVSENDAMSSIGPDPEVRRETG